MKIKHRIKYICFYCLVAFTSCLATTWATQTSLPDVGLITKLSGEVTYRNKGDDMKPAKMRALMKVYQGDQLELLEASSLTLLYFASGRQETWRGPAILVAGDHESQVLGGKQPAPQPEVKIIPVKASKQMSQALPSMCPASMSKSGIIQTMGPKRKLAVKTATPLFGEAQRKINEAEKVYLGLKKDAAVDDITPELYFLSVLAEYKQISEMAKMVDAMLQKRPGDAALLNLRAWVRSQPLDFR